MLPVGGLYPYDSEFNGKKKFESSDMKRVTKDVSWYTDGIPRENKFPYWEERRSCAAMTATFVNSRVWCVFNKILFVCVFIVILPMWRWNAEIHFTIRRVKALTLCYRWDQYLIRNISIIKIQTITRHRGAKYSHERYTLFCLLWKQIRN